MPTLLAFVALFAVLALSLNLHLFGLSPVRAFGVCPTFGSCSRTKKSMLQCALLLAFGLVVMSDPNASFNDYAGWLLALVFVGVELS